MVSAPLVSWLSEDPLAAVCAAPPTKRNAPKKPTSARAKQSAKAKKTAAKKKDTKKKDARKKQARRPAPKKKTTAQRTTKPVLTAEQEAAEYQEKVAAVQEHNAQVAAYLNRDISHRIGVWGQVGYSAIFPKSFDFNADANLGFTPHAVGGVGGGAGIGYQLRYKRFLFTTGAEFQMYNSLTNIDPFSRTFDMTPYATMHYTYAYSDMRDRWSAGYIQIPLLFGMELADWYWQVGGKIGVNVLGSSEISSLLSTSIQDDELIDDLHNMYTHALVSDYNVPPTVQTVRWGINGALAAEVGMSLDRWLQPTIKRGKKPTPAQRFAQNMHYRIALFAEYGVLNIQSPANIPTDADNDAPADFRTVLSQSLAQPADLYEQVAYTSALSTTSARNAYLSPLLVGVKISMYYELPRRPKKMLPIPAEPRPRLAAWVTNAETGKSLAGAQITIENIASGQTINKTTNSKGLTLPRVAKGQYRVTAAKAGFLPGDTIEVRHSRDLADTLYFALRPEPKPIVYTLSGYVSDHETRQALEAEVRILSEDSVVCYTGSTSEDGLFVSNLTAGAYTLHVTSPGYMPLSEYVLFEQDTLQLFMDRIKEGIKVKINHLYFATNKVVILPESEAALTDLADFLHENPTVTIRITGHTDAVGSDASNMRLSLGRAKAVRAALIDRGIDADRIEFDGKGKTEPVATNDTEEGRAQNRRVEFEIIDTAGEDIQQVY